MTTLSPRFTQAVEYARVAHAAQFRKGTSIPYLYHLLGVSSLVLEYGGSEDQAIAGLLHDVIEDCGKAHEAQIRAQFGDTVADIVKDCTDGSAESKNTPASAEARLADWTARKQAYLKHLSTVSATSMLVSGCDKLHNARAILIDLEGETGVAVFDRFTAQRDGILRYYASIGRIFARHQAPMAAALERVVTRIHQLAGRTTPEYLEAA